MFKMSLRQEKLFETIKIIAESLCGHLRSCTNPNEETYSRREHTVPRREYVMSFKYDKKSHIWMNHEVMLNKSFQ